MCPNQNPEPTPSDTDSVPDVTWVLPGELVGRNDPQFASVKCTNCKKPTQHMWIKVAPVFVETPYTEDIQLEILKLTKRLQLCTVCANMRLTN